MTNLKKNDTNTPVEPEVPVEPVTEAPTDPVTPDPVVEDPPVTEPPVVDPTPEPPVNESDPTPPEQPVEPPEYDGPPKTQYSDAGLIRSLRHSEKTYRRLLAEAITYEDYKISLAHKEWSDVIPGLVAERDKIIEDNKLLPSEEQKEVPELPEEPVADLSVRRSYYVEDHVDVDHELCTEDREEKKVYDDVAHTVTITPQCFVQAPDKILKAKKGRFKLARQAKIDSLQITVDGRVYDANEISRSRMVDALSVMTSTSKQVWVLADNSLFEHTKVELTAVKNAIIKEQSRIWIEELVAFNEGL